MRSTAKLEVLKSRIESAPIFNVGEYRYFVNPLQGIAEPVKADLLKEITNALASLKPVKEADMVVCIEAMSIGLGYLLAVEAGKPVTIVRKKNFPLEGKVAVRQKTGYSEGSLFLYGDYKGKKVAIVDDLLSTGGTLISLVKALKEKGATVTGVAVVMERGTGKTDLEKATGVEVFSLCRVEVREKPVAEIH